MTRSNKAEFDAAFNWIQSNWDDNLKRYRTSVPYWTRSVVGRLSTRAQLDAATAFYGAPDKVAVIGPMSQSWTDSRARVAWSERDTADVKAFFGLA